MESLVRAMHEAHRAGVVHRDLKPANVLVADDDTPKIADFGLAKVLDADTALTRTGSILGSPCSMAPEQAVGQARGVGPAADLYALAAIYFELLTGRPSLRGATILATLEPVRNAEPVPPLRLVPGLPRDAETIRLKCLQKDPSRRNATAAELADAGNCSEENRQQADPEVPELRGPSCHRLYCCRIHGKATSPHTECK